MPATVIVGRVANVNALVKGVYTLNLSFASPRGDYKIQIQYNDGDMLEYYFNVPFSSNDYLEVQFPGTTNGYNIATRYYVYDQNGNTVESGDVSIVTVDASSVAVPITVNGLPSGVPVVVTTQSSIGDNFVLSLLNGNVVYSLKPVQNTYSYIVQILIKTDKWYLWSGAVNINTAPFAVNFPYDFTSSSSPPNIYVVDTLNGGVSLSSQAMEATDMTKFLFSPYFGEYNIPATNAVYSDMINYLSSKIDNLYVYLAPLDASSYACYKYNSPAPNQESAVWRQLMEGSQVVYGYYFLSTYQGGVARIIEILRKILPEIADAVKAFDIRQGLAMVKTMIIKNLSDLKDTLSKISKAVAAQFTRVKALGTLKNFAWFLAISGVVLFSFRELGNIVEKIQLPYETCNTLLTMYNNYCATNKWPKDQCEQLWSLVQIKCQQAGLPIYNPIVQTLMLVLFIIMMMVVAVTMITTIRR
ncbi:MAG: hypothetical protein JZD41_03635 [Thermoproteus sp.]|nr:hypothetical protein [Thermoproteus sp.]